MPAVEDQLCAELTRVAETVQPGQLRPLREPARGPARRRLLPVIAAVAATVVTVVAAVLASGPSGQRGVAMASARPAVMPRYYVTVARTSIGLEAAARDSAHGTVTGLVRCRYVCRRGTVRHRLAGRPHVRHRRRPDQRQHSSRHRRDVVLLAARLR